MRRPRSARRRSASAAPSSRTRYRRAVFSPAKEKSSPGSLRAIGKPNADGSPSRASRSSAAPPGYPNPSSRAPLSNASPAASSSVCPTTSNRGPQSVTRASNVWPPLAMRPRYGGSNGSGARRPAAMCPWRWSTGASGSSCAAASALRGTHSHEQRPHQPRTAGDRYQFEVAESGAAPTVRNASSTTAPINLEVVTGGDLRHHPAVTVVDALQKRSRSPWISPSRGYDRRARVVATGFEREDHPGAPVPEGPRALPST